MQSNVYLPNYQSLPHSPLIEKSESTLIKRMVRDTYSQYHHKQEISAKQLYTMWIC